jgi:quercetin dioxygenase-like cupin family protein
MSRDPATETTMIDDERVRVTRFDFAKGAQTGWHVHAHDYVVITLTDCHMLLEEPGGTSRTVTIEAGTSYRREQGVEHNVINEGDDPMAFVEVELK